MINKTHLQVNAVLFASIIGISVMLLIHNILKILFVLDRLINNSSYGTMCVW